MKIIEAMKDIKRLQEKTADLRKKVGLHSANLDYETPVYPDQEKQLAEWIQAHTDSVKRIKQLRVAIQRTNIVTTVKVELNGIFIEQTIAEWIQRRRDLAKLDAEMWATLTDRGLKEGFAQGSAGNQVQVKIRRYYDPSERDRKLAEYREEPSRIDAAMEVANAVTDLIEGPLAAAA